MDSVDFATAKWVGYHLMYLLSQSMGMTRRAYLLVELKKDITDILINGELYVVWNASWWQIKTVPAFSNQPNTTRAQLFKT